MADTRIHGTTKQHVKLVFEQAERAALLPLPLERFACFQEGSGRSIATGTSKWPRRITRRRRSIWDARSGRAGTRGWCASSIIASSRSPCTCGTSRAASAPTPSTCPREDQRPGARRGLSLEQGRAWSAPFTRQWAEAMLNARGIEGTRVLQGLLGADEEASLRSPGKSLRNRPFVRLLAAPRVRQLWDARRRSKSRCRSCEEHPIIRPLADYGAIVARAIHRQADRPSVGEGFGRHGWTKVCAGTASPLATENPGAKCDLDRGLRTLPPRSGYPSPGCSPAEPDSVSPDTPA